MWITWELFKELTDLPATSFYERCNFKNCTIYVGGL